MSILQVDAIRDNGATFNDVVTFANSGGTENGKLARAWVNFNGQGTIAIRTQFNVNSLADRGTGAYTVLFANSMADANYVIVNGGAFIVNAIPDTAAQALVNTYASNFGAQDKDVVEVAVFR